MTTSLPEPSFIERDPSTIEAEVFQTWLDMGGNNLQPGQIEALFLKTIAYRESLVRMGVQEAAKQNLLRYAQFPVVDYLGELLNTPRLGAQASLATCRWYLDAAHGTDVPIEAGTRARTQDGRYYFRTRRLAIIPAGSLYIDTLVECTVAGSEANGYLAGQISDIVDPTPLVASVTNLGTTRDGSPAETTAQYVERLLVAPDAMSSAGGSETYRYYALSASAAVADVAVTSPSEGQVRIIVLSTSGSPSPELLTLVADAVNPEQVRPLTDTVTVVAATAVDWSLSAALTLFAKTDSDSVLASARAAAENYVGLRRTKLHRSAKRSQIYAELRVPGVFDMVIASPAADVLAAENQWLNCTLNTVTIAGFTTEESDDA